MHVTRLQDLDPEPIHRLTSNFGLELIQVADGASIPASYWGEPEAGIAGRCLFVCGDTPVHSLLHETCHFVCMTGERRGGLWRDAGGDFEEESAVCYLQVLLADTLQELGRDRLFGDLDAWGYSFREGSSEAWFEGDGRAARDWLEANGLISTNGVPTWQLRR